MDDQASSLRKLVQDKTEYEPSKQGMPQEQLKPQAAVSPSVSQPAKQSQFYWQQTAASTASKAPSTGYAQPYTGYSATPAPTARPTYTASIAPASAVPYVASPLSQPVQPKAGTQANRQNFQSAVHEKGARIVAVTSGKGGVGKTNLTVNLAIAMSMEGKRVLVIDADLGMANVDVVLGTVSKHHLMHLLKPDIKLEDVLIHGPYGVNYISGGSAIERAVEFTIAERQILLDKLSACGDIADVILIDTGAGLGQNVMEFILSADEVVLVTTPEPTAMTDAYAVMKAYNSRAQAKNMKLVVNRIYDENEGKDVTEKLRRTAERFLSMRLPSLGYIYEDRNVMNAVKKQAPLLIAYPNTLAARCVHAVAQGILYGGRKSVNLGWRGFLQKLLKFNGK